MIEKPDRQFVFFAPTLVVLALLAGSVPHRAAADVHPVDFTLVDAHGTVIGPAVVRRQNEVEVSLVVDGHATVLLFDLDRFRPINEPFGGVYYFSADCTGQAYTDIGAVGFLETQAVSGTNLTFFAPMAGGSPINPPLTFNSTLRWGAEGCVPEATTIDVGGSFFPIEPVRDLAPLWQPPFRLVATATATPVPAVSPLGLAVLALALGAGSLLVLRRRRHAA